MSLLRSVLLPVSLPSFHCCTRSIFAPRLIRALSMAPHSSSQPEQSAATRENTFVEGTNKQMKEKKNPKTLVAPPAYPLEVWPVENTQFKLTNWTFSCNPPPSSSIIAWKSSTSSRMNMTLGFLVCFLWLRFRTHTHFLLLKRNQEKISLSPCLMARNARAEVGKLVQWRSPKRCPRAFQSVWSLQKYETLVCIA